MADTYSTAPPHGILKLVSPPASLIPLEGKCSQYAVYSRDLVFVPYSHTSVSMADAYSTPLYCILKLVSPPASLVPFEGKYSPYAMLGGWVNPHREQQTYTAGSNIEPAQILLHANGQSAHRASGARDVGRGAESHTEHGLGVWHSNPLVLPQPQLPRCMLKDTVCILKLVSPPASLVPLEDECAGPSLPF